MLYRRNCVPNSLNASPPLEFDDSVRCVVIRGAGAHFMAGGDIRIMRQRLQMETAERSRNIVSGLHDIHHAIFALRRMPKPVIASVQGAAAGFGLSLVAATDLAIAADDAVFTLAYCHIGASPDGGLILLPWPHTWYEAADGIGIPW